MAEWKSSEIGEIAGALAAAQAEFGKLVASKTAEIKTKGSGRDYSYTYANLADALEACRVTLNKHGIAVIQMPVTSARNGIEVSTMLLHSSGQWLRSEEPLFMPVSGGAQDVGSAITYGRRYSLLAMVGLAPEDDDGKKAQEAKPGRWRDRGESRDRPKPRQVQEPSAPKPRGDLTMCSAGMGNAIAAQVSTLAEALGFPPNRIWDELLTRARIDISAYLSANLKPPNGPKKLFKSDAQEVKRAASSWVAEAAIDAAAENAP